MDDLSRTGDSLVMMQVQKKEKAQTGNLAGKETCRKIKAGIISALSTPLLAQLRGGLVGVSVAVFPPGRGDG